MPYSNYLKFDIKFIKFANFIVQGLDKKLFIRYYIPAISNQQIQVDTREIESKNSVLWNECASFEYRANSDQIKRLEKSRHVIFELRSRRSRKFFGGIMRSRSRLLGRGEVSWKDVMEANGMELKKWVHFSANIRKEDGLKLPSLLVDMKVQVTRVDVDSNEKRVCGFNKECCWVESDIDMFHVETIID